ncbi:MAG: hypothetical protein RL695_638 [Pseudomonadota bacterium]|jgi:peptidoglycan/LPS O-acetylase OafA/YrhL
MGFYRFFLALLVAVSHTGINVYGFNPGVVAVISFFLLSGYVMTQLIRKYYLQPARISRFYLDRAARLFPQYLFYFTLASLFLYISDMPTIFTHKLNATKWLLNIPILPLGFYQWLLDGATVLPQAWSLGLEMCFYLVIPWLLLCCSRGQIHALAAASFLIFLTAFTGLIDTDAFGYRLLPGTLFMFLVGAAFAEDDTARSARLFRHAITAAAAILLAFACWQTRYYALPYNKEVLLGLLLGLVALSLLRHRSRSAPDEFFGNLSYGVFLNHFIVIWWLRKHYDIEAYGGFDVIMLLLISTLMATASFYFVERPAIHWRHSIRQVTSNKQ